ncbi:hypothetical protein, partial [Streptomyces sp. ERV7]|uniref:hypothetical protein n=1 Tax=Streptomyces sp. ERV7 TaxID=1322334 RepID=UPI00131E3738
MEDLLAAGFRLNAPAGPAPKAPPAAVVVHGGRDQEHVLELSDDVAALRAELERVRHEHALALAEARHGKELAEARESQLRDQLALRAEHVA